MRRLSGAVGWAVGGWAAAAALFHIWTAYAGAWEPREMRAVHLLFLIPLGFVLFPPARAPRNTASPSSTGRGWWHRSSRAST